MRGKCDSPFEQNRITRWLPPSDLIWLESQAHRLRVAGIDARVVSLGKFLGHSRRFAVARFDRVYLTSRVKWRQQKFFQPVVQS